MRPLSELLLGIGPFFSFGNLVLNLYDPLHSCKKHFREAVDVMSKTQDTKLKYMTESENRTIEKLKRLVQEEEKAINKFKRKVCFQA